jgi:hypothetical protein
MKKLLKWLKEFSETSLGIGIITTLRNAVIAIGGLVIAEVIGMVSGSALSPEMKLIVVGVLKLIDEGLHKTGVAEKGLTRF